MTSVIVQDMADKWLGTAIQESPGLHDAQEDAVATMALFRDHVLTDPSQLSGADLEKHYLHCMLTAMAARSEDQK